MDNRNLLAKVGTQKTKKNSKTDPQKSRDAQGAREGEAVSASYMIRTKRCWTPLCTYKHNIN
jgi:hypothetical protein